MNQCVSDDLLLLCYLDEGSAAARLHLAACPSCASRYQRLSQTLTNAEQELRVGCPPRVPSYRWSSSHWWFPATAAIAVIIMVLWRVGMPRPVSPSEHRSTRDSEVLRFLADEVSPALLATSQMRTNPFPTPISPAGYVHAAVTGGWPCEQSRPFTAPQCESVPFFFFFED